MGEREGVDKPDAVFHARAVVDVRGDALTAGEVARMRDQLPDDYAPLFAGSQGHI